MRLALALLIGLTLPASAQWGRPRDTGGEIGERILEIVAAAGSRHEIRGDCMSSCTMWLGAFGACVYPDAVLWFHSARGPGGDLSQVGNRALLTFYPPRVRRAVLAGGYLNSPTLRPMTGVQLIRLGVPAC